ncbi:MAG: TetR/AcrR family transcriptional regulator [Clostridia bacterium]|nr:TetR/AcrR family transcriptional regulator [Clostridia bacterium]MCL6521205.1 TetR/AcrR family transcriptional regulator [Bacillota bacterium]
MKLSLPSYGAPDEVRERIFRSATRLFAQHGFAGVSVRAIAEAANTTKPMIYYYFGNKEQLYRTVVTEHLERLAQATEAALARARTLETGIRRFVVVYLRYFTGYGPSMQIVAREMFGFGEQPLREVRLLYFGRLVGTLSGFVQRFLPRAPAREARAGALTILGIVNIFLVQRLVESQGHLDVRRVLEQVLRVYLPAFGVRSGSWPGLPAGAPADPLAGAGAAVETR